jgi:hypothetical protein
LVFWVGVLGKLTGAGEIEIQKWEMRRPKGEARSLCARPGAPKQRRGREGRAGALGMTTRAPSQRRRAEYPEKARRRGIPHFSDSVRNDKRREFPQDVEA